MSLHQLVTLHRPEIERLAAARGATAVRIFGSVARGEDDAESDVDFLVTMSPGRSLFDMGGLLMDLQQLLRHKVDVVSDQGIRPRIRDRVLREAVPLAAF
jgi:uncharacterized protein